MKSIYFFIAILFFSCTQDKGHPNNIFFVSNGYNLRRDSVEKGLLPGPLPPPVPFYMNYHFLVDSAGQLYYYQLDQNGWFCGTGYDYNVPLFMGLKPDKLFQVSETNVVEVVKKNILSQEPSFRWVIIGLKKDTIESNGLAKLMDMLKSDSNKVKWNLRKATLEESVIVDYKRKKLNYNSDSILWDTTKIKFINLPIKFTPPKPEVE